MYIEHSSLYFSDNGIFLKTLSDDWQPIGNIHYDVQGYFIKINDPDFDIKIESGIDDNHVNRQEFEWDSVEIIECGSRVSQESKKWKCFYCNRLWFIGEECTYEGCPTNQWKRKTEEKS